MYSQVDPVTKFGPAQNIIVIILGHQMHLLTVSHSPKMWTGRKHVCVCVCVRECELTLSVSVACVLACMHAYVRVYACVCVCVV